MPLSFARSSDFSPLDYFLNISKVKFMRQNHIIWKILEIE